MKPGFLDYYLFMSLFWYAKILGCYHVISELSATEVLQGVLQWHQKNKAKGASAEILKTMPFLFLVLDSLYIEIGKLQIKSVSGNKEKKIICSDVFTLGIFLNPAEYSKLRNILSLLGDVYNICYHHRPEYLLSLCNSKDKLQKPCQNQYLRQKTDR